MAMLREMKNKNFTEFTHNSDCKGNLWGILLRHSLGNLCYLVLIFVPSINWLIGLNSCLIYIFYNNIKTSINCQPNHINHKALIKCKKKTQRYSKSSSGTQSPVGSATPRARHAQFVKTTLKESVPIACNGLTHRLPVKWSKENAAISSTSIAWTNGFRTTRVTDVCTVQACGIKSDRSQSSNDLTNYWSVHILYECIWY